MKGPPPLSASAAVLMAMATLAYAKDARDPMKIMLTVSGESLPISLSDTRTAQDFAALLPLTLTLQDYGTTEKIADLPEKLSTDDAPPGVKPVVGDVAYYAPWGNLAIFVEDFPYSRGLVTLGRVETGVDLAVLRRRGPLKATLVRSPEE